MHGDASQPSIFLEQFLHIRLYDLERVQIPNKHPEQEEILVGRSLDTGSPKKHENWKTTFHRRFRKK